MACSGSTIEIKKPATLFLDCRATSIRFNSNRIEQFARAVREFLTVSVNPRLENTKPALHQDHIGLPAAY
jgi:hypothetical protein